MIKINYPSRIKDRYIKLFDINELSKHFSFFLYKYGLARHVSIDINNLLVSKFDRLILIVENFDRQLRIIQKYDNNESSDGYKNYKKAIDELLTIFNYTGNQPKISSFFMENRTEMKLGTCFYCNLDYVNMFPSLAEYLNVFDFIKDAEEFDFAKIAKIGSDTSKKLYNNKDVINNLEDISNIIGKGKRYDNLVNLKEKETEYLNGFTLDHVIDKAAHPILSLSLYNFVPSCYICNSKLKGVKSIIGSDKKSKLSPTSNDFSFDKDVRFGILPKIGIDRLMIKKESDFVLILDNLTDEYKDYINVFKLKQRYIFHKREIVDLIRKKVNYTDDYIDVMAKTLHKSKNSIKKDIFGREIFEGELQEKSLTKMKRDVARTIGVKGVKYD